MHPSRSSSASPWSAIARATTVPPTHKAASDCAVARARALSDKPCSKTVTIALKTTSKAFCALLLLRATSLGRVPIGEKFSDRMRTSLHQEIDFKAGAQRVYDALLDSKQFGALSGEPAQIDHKDGGVFSMFGGKIVGRHVELIANQRIVQAWRPANWDPGAYSSVKFELKEQGGRTMRVLDHTGFPEGGFEHLNPRWKMRYWDPLERSLA
jgi:uncharacterized protein YndB with AHSA1/START domain